MPAIGTVVPRIHRTGPSIIDSNGKWVGSKLGRKADLVTLDANGRYDQIVAAGNAVTSATGRIGALGQGIKSTVLVDAKCQVEKFDDQLLIALPCATAAGAAKATTQAMKGKQFPLFRDASGNYVVNTDSNVNPVVECVEIDPNYGIGEVGGLLLCRVLPGSRLS